MGARLLIRARCHTWPSSQGYCGAPSSRSCRLLAWCSSTARRSRTRSQVPELHGPQEGPAGRDRPRVDDAAVHAVERAPRASPYGTPRAGTLLREHLCQPTALQPSLHSGARLVALGRGAVKHAARAAPGRGVSRSEAHGEPWAPDLGRCSVRMVHAGRHGPGDPK